MNKMVYILLTVSSVFAQGDACMDVRTNIWGLWIADSLAYNDGDSVANFVNLEGTTAKDWNNSTAGLYPVLKTGIVNGHDVVRFDGINDVLVFTQAITGGELELYIVLKVDADPPSSADQAGSWGNLSTTTSSSHNSHYPYTSGTVYESFGRNDARITVGNPTPSLASWRLYNVLADTNQHVVRLDTVIISNPVTTYNPVYTSPKKLGESWQNVYSFDGDIAEVRLYRPKLSTAQRDSLQSYFTTRYGLSYAATKTCTVAVTRRKKKLIGTR